MIICDTNSCVFVNCNKQPLCFLEEKLILKVVYSFAYLCYDTQEINPFSTKVYENISFPDAIGLAKQLHISVLLNYLFEANLYMSVTGETADSRKHIFLKPPTKNI